MMGKNVTIFCCLHIGGKKCQKLFSRKINIVYVIDYVIMKKKEKKRKNNKCLSLFM